MLSTKHTLMAILVPLPTELLAVSCMLMHTTHMNNNTKKHYKTHEMKGLIFN